MTQNKNPVGLAGLRKWNPAFKQRHIPDWFESRLKAALSKDGNHAPPVWFLLHDGRFDHWGSVVLPDSSERAVYTMPSGLPPDCLSDLARRMGCGLRVTTPGPWSPLTTLFLFTVED